MFSYNLQLIIHIKQAVAQNKYILIGKNSPIIATGCIRYYVGRYKVRNSSVKVRRVLSHVDYDARSHLACLFLAPASTQLLREPSEQNQPFLLFKS